MKRVLSLLALMLPLVLSAQTEQPTMKSNCTGIQTRLGIGLEYYSDGYFGHYAEYPRTSVLVQGTFRHVLLGAGFDMIHTGEGNHDSAVNVRAGYQFEIGRLGGDAYLLVEKTVKSKEPYPTLFGCGFTLNYKLAGPLNVYTDIRAHSPLFSHPTGYGYYGRAFAGCVNIGIMLKF